MPGTPGTPVFLPASAMVPGALLAATNPGWPPGVAQAGRVTVQSSVALPIVTDHSNPSLCAAIGSNKARLCH